MIFVGKKNSREELSAEKESAAKEYVTLGKEGYAEYIEKKSVFIAYAAPVKSSEQAIEYIKNVKTRYSDARHNVYAYLISAENATRYSDDGEPQGTAGIPVLNVIRKGEFTDAVITVTRYFGGILLGAPGLLRAYTTAAADAVKDAGIVRYSSFTEFTAVCSYSDYQRLEAELPRLGVRVDESSFGDGVELRLAVKDEGYPAALKRLSDITSGRIIITECGKRFDF